MGRKKKLSREQEQAMFAKMNTSKQYTKDYEQSTPSAIRAARFRTLTQHNDKIRLLERSKLYAEMQYDAADAALPKLESALRTQHLEITKMTIGKTGTTEEWLPTDRARLEIHAEPANNKFKFIADNSTSAERKAARMREQLIKESELEHIEVNPYSLLKSDRHKGRVLISHWTPASQTLSVNRVSNALSTAEELYKQFEQQELLDDRREYDVADLRSAYPDLSESEAKKLERMLHDE